MRPRLERTRTGTAPAAPGFGTQAPAKDIATNAARKRLLVRPRTPAVSSARSRASTKATPKRPPARCRLWVWAARGAVTTACIGLMPPLNLLPERYLVEMRRRVTIATASRAPPRTPWKPPRYSTSSTWQRRRGVRCSSPAHRRACRHLVRDPMGVDRPAVTLGCSCGGPQPPRAAGALMRTETSHEAREDQRKSPIGR